MKSANSGGPTPTKHSSNGNNEDKFSHRLYQSHQQNINGKGEQHEFKHFEVSSLMRSAFT